MFDGTGVFYRMRVSQKNKISKNNFLLKNFRVKNSVFYRMRN